MFKRVRNHVSTRFNAEHFWNEFSSMLGILSGSLVIAGVYFLLFYF